MLTKAPAKKPQTKTTKKSMGFHMVGGEVFDISTKFNHFHYMEAHQNGKLCYYIKYNNTTPIKKTLKRFIDHIKSSQEN